MAKTIEAQLTTALDTTLVRAVGSLFESTQNATTLGFVGYPAAESLRARLGPKAGQVWDAADRHWSAMEQRVVGDRQASLAGVTDPRVRAVVIAANRRRADGTYTTLAQFIREELRSGEPQ